MINKYILKVFPDVKAQKFAGKMYLRNDFYLYLSHTLSDTRF